MEKVKEKILLKKIGNTGTYADDWIIIIQNEKQVIEKCIDQWLKDDMAIEIELDFEIKSIFQFKTTSQLGYLFAEVLKKFFDYMTAEGDDRSAEIKRRDLFMHPAINFCDYDINSLTGELQQTIKSLATSSKEEVKDLIDRLIRLGADFGIEIETPEDYKKRKGIKEFTK